MWIFVVVLLLPGLLQVGSPVAGWWLANFWKVESGAEPSRLSLVLLRMQGIVFLLVSAGLAWHQLQAS